jgi:hypothetical protein
MVTFEVEVDSPVVRYIQLEDGNIDFEAGIRLFIRMLDSQMKVVNRRHFIFSGDDFKKWLNNPNGQKSIMDVISEFLNCKSMRMITAEQMIKTSLAENQ